MTTLNDAVLIEWAAHVRDLFNKHGAPIEGNDPRRGAFDYITDSDGPADLGRKYFAAVLEQENMDSPIPLPGWADTATVSVEAFDWPLVNVLFEREIRRGSVKATAAAYAYVAADVCGEYDDVYLPGDIIKNDAATPDVFVSAPEGMTPSEGAQLVDALTVLLASIEQANR